MRKLLASLLIGLPMTTFAATPADRRTHRAEHDLLNVLNHHSNPTA